MAEQTTMSNVYTDRFESFIEERSSAEPQWLIDLRKAAFARFTELGFPTLKHEDWRNTNVKPIAEGNFAIAEAIAEIDGDEINRLSIPGIEGHRLVFVNGHFVESLSHVGDLPKNVRVSTVKNALESDGELLRRHYGQYADYQNQAFVALNLSYANDGAFVYFGKGSTVEEPIHLVFVSTGKEQSAGYTHNAIVAEEGAQGTLITNYVSLGDAEAFTSVVTEAAVDERAYVDVYNLQREAQTVRHISALAIYQKASSVFRAHTITFGGLLTRNDVVAKLDGEHAEGIINGLYLLSGKQHVDNWMWVEHMRENIPSHELYKGVLDDEASAAFTGRIYVHKEAQKTDAKQTNQNLLLSPNARAHTKPQLEIYADDVKCTHGATIGQLDATALFYLKSRGIGKEEARNLLVRAFASDITERIKLKEVYEVIQEELVEQLTRTLRS